MIKKILVVTWNIIAKLFPYAVTVTAALLFIGIQKTNQECLQNMQAQVSEMENSQATIFSEQYKIDLSLLAIDNQLTEGIAQAKAEFIKRNNDLLKVVYA